MSRAASLRLIVVALLALALGWSLAPHGAPPVYDGIGFPDEPYRFVVAPDGANPTKAPTTATGTSTVVGGLSGALRASSAEQAPQISLLLPGGRLHGPRGTTRITLTASPIKPLAVPSGQHLWSNVYEVAATSAGVTLRDANPHATLTMRAATAQRPYPRIERYTNAGWQPLQTTPVGTDIYEAPLPALGRYAVIGTSPIDVSRIRGNGATKKSSASTKGIVITVAAGVVVIALVVVGVVRRRRRGATEGETG